MRFYWYTNKQVKESHSYIPYLVVIYLKLPKHKTRIAALLLSQGSDVTNNLVCKRNSIGNDYLCGCTYKEFEDDIPQIFLYCS
jgi:hypothetical protein